jgi:predicted SPOUT superfamily RNA methylase MTH1
MKKILLIFAIFGLLTCSNIQAQNKTEYCILRIVNTIKTTGVESKLYINIGSSQIHSLKGVFENNKNGTISIKNSDGTTTIIKDEVDFLSIIERYGFKLIEVYSNSILEKSYVNYLFEKRQ